MSLSNFLLRCLIPIKYFPLKTKNVNLIVVFNGITKATLDIFLCGPNSLT